MISEGILEKQIADYISNRSVAQTERHYMSKEEITQLHTNI